MAGKLKNVSRFDIAELIALRPQDRRQLRGWIHAALGITVPDRALCAGHACPMDYLEHVFFERPGDPIVWANRGGGKTFYGALATLLDLIHKPGIEIRILGGSFEQSRRMDGYLRRMLDRPGLRDLIRGRWTKQGVRLTNGSGVELLCQSERSVRGHRVQKLRCDEVELFDPEVWSACQFVTRSAQCGPHAVRGAIEALSTMHRPMGLMANLVQQARQSPAAPVTTPMMPTPTTPGISHSPAEPSAPVAPPAGGPAPSGWKLFQWCALDVMGPCEPQRACDGCALWPECGGRARSVKGFIAVEDVLGQKRRSSRAAYESEMLCLRPSRSDSVFPMFDPAWHVRPVPSASGLRWIGGIDFGIRNPFVMLWAQLRPIAPVAPQDGAAAGPSPAAPGGWCVEVIDEYIQSDGTLADHLKAMAARPWPGPRWVGADPAGHQRSEQTGLSAISVLGRAGLTVRSRRAPILAGLETIKIRLEAMLPHRMPAAPPPGPDAVVEPATARPQSAGVSASSASVASPASSASRSSPATLASFAPAEPSSPAATPPGLLIHPRCKGLITALTCYHFDAQRPWSQDPVKDGHDHPIDALRYMLVNLPTDPAARMVEY